MQQTPTKLLCIKQAIVFLVAKFCQISTQNPFPTYRFHPSPKMW